MDLTIYQLLEAVSGCNDTDIVNNLLQLSTEVDCLFVFETLFYNFLANVVD